MRVTDALDLAPEGLVGLPVLVGAQPRSGLHDHVSGVVLRQPRALLQRVLRLSAVGRRPAGSRRPVAVLQLVPVQAGDLEHVGAELAQVVPLVVRVGMCRAGAGQSRSLQRQRCRQTDQRSFSPFVRVVVCRHRSHLMSSAETLVLFQPKKLGYIQKLASVKTSGPGPASAPCSVPVSPRSSPAARPRNAWLTWRDDD